MRWADYATGRPPASALKAAGFGGVLRYVGLGGGPTLPYKRITAAEYQDHVRNGLQVLLVCEGSTTDAWAGYNAGVANAKVALADARALGIPDTVGIAAAADSHAANPAQIAAAVEYARGFQDVLGKARTGFYGFSETVTAVRAAGIGSWYWRCGSQPTTTERAWTNLWQRNDGTTTVAGTTVDINEQYLPLPNGDDMQLTDSFVDWAGNTQTVQSWMNNIDQRVALLWDLMLGNGITSLVDGKQYAGRDVLALIDLHTCQDSDVNKQVLTVLQGMTTGNVDVAALATALQSTLAPEIVKALGAKLSS